MPFGEEPTDASSRALARKPRVAATLQRECYTPTERRRGRLGLYGAIAAGVGAGIVMPPTMLLSVPALILGVSLSRSYSVGRRIDAGEFDPVMRRCRRALEDHADGPFREIALAQLAELLMRQGELDQAVRFYAEIVESGHSRILVRYARVMAAACDVLQGRETEVELGAVPQGGAIGYCIVAARRGETERALGVRVKLNVLDRIYQGRRRLAHDGRLLRVLHTAVRGDAENLTGKQRARMHAAYAGEYDYVADRWPEVQQVVETLDLYRRGSSTALLGQ